MVQARHNGKSLLESARFQAKLAARASGLSWTDFKTGERVRHFEYGDGTIKLVSAAGFCITWDEPIEVRDDYQTAIANWLHHI